MDSQTVENVVFYICVIALVSLGIYLKRIFADMDIAGREVHASDFIPEQSMQSVYNPFNFSIDSSGSSLKDGLKFSLDSQEPGYAVTCWGASITDIYPLIYMPWQKLKGFFQNSSRAQELLQKHCLSSKYIKFDCCQKEEMHFQPKASVDLGPVPRDKYPLVLFLVSQSMEMNIQEPDAIDESNVVFHAVIIHLKDDVCQLDSHIISHFVRSAGGMPCDLKQLYTSGREGHFENIEEDSEKETTVQDQGPNIQFSNSDTLPDLCVVCHTNNVNKVFLPCRHTCICDDCFVKIDKCPMCRGIVHSCFSLGESIPSDDPDEQNADEEHWFYRLNNRLNNFFGFT